MLVRASRPPDHPHGAISTVSASLSSGVVHLVRHLRIVPHAARPDVPIANVVVVAELEPVADADHARSTLTGALGARLVDLR